MGRAGKVLKYVLDQYGISQNRLATAMGVARSTVNQWVHEVSDPLPESIPEIIAALETLEPSAASIFVSMYLKRDAKVAAGDVRNHFVTGSDNITSIFSYPAPRQSSSHSAPTQPSSSYPKNNEAAKVLFNSSTTVFNIKVFDQDIDPVDLEELKSAIANYAEAAGYTDPDILSEKWGSFFSSIRYRIAKILSPRAIEEATREGEEFYRRGKEDLKARLEKTGVDATQKLATATAELLKAVEPFDNIVLTLGKIILIKYTTPDGRTRTIVRTVSTEIQNKLESTPNILNNPRTLLAFLQREEKVTQTPPLSVAPEENRVS